VLVYAGLRVHTTAGGNGYPEAPVAVADRDTTLLSGRRAPLTGDRLFFRVNVAVTAAIGQFS